MILTVTPNPAVDHTIHFDEPLETGVVHRTDDAVFTAGGKGINVAKYVSALDVDAAATGFLGGHFGKFVRDRLDADGVSADFVAIDDDTRLNTTVLAEDGEYKLNHNGPQIRAAHVDELVETVQANDPDTLLVGGSLPPGMSLSAVDRLARAGNWRTAVDMGGESLSDLEADYFVCKPNRSELAAATGRTIETDEDAVAAAEELQNRGFEYVLASLGADGALLVTDDEVLSAPAADVEVVDTVGAGDAILSGFIAAREHGLDDADALRMGILTAARVVSVAGTRVPDLDGVLTNETRIEVTTVRRR
ncbi:1-phosphofructokinase family hexose kinase [Haloferax mediterranei ATCC 33500]|uniref:1-phosphofructokinase n=1 Tax=Haloferax mediterranei (strain ATCC 33500 / DSM 1411 / JCM 8866 / NBRC 14739 / NCIMB 2177 / R-4) TaxID=523841 RepID=I3R4W1_HALMT|nr:1-phosphofructokinase [Haloferax mediterranei]AFK19271.1 1-phosphofructokinase [Haloferax mediterranei ATCC 33500]AHZ21370.1 1-phosphofructokinase [Haloferax mediterranei ATCC 33500]EMA04540.1 1-phosphofructokinase [Haloferax mediterranei ATCC 33500]MDX5989374.1 1-phosphofructokinase [Haloferax mediterranei ATCC 33500]QCQ75738.1 1-phosphofructokinase family hexose kinase [Haloferax mediterranei ATCC 33500]